MVYRFHSNQRVLRSRFGLHHILSMELALARLRSAGATTSMDQQLTTEVFSPGKHTKQSVFDIRRHGHGEFRRHLFRIGKAEDPFCPACPQVARDESSTQTLWMHHLRRRRQIAETTYYCLAYSDLATLILTRRGSSSSRTPSICHRTTIRSTPPPAKPC